MGNEDEDVTLKLVDDLLRHIVSFLPIKDGLRMSVLSTRWRYLWTRVSKIDLYDSIPYANRPEDYPHCRTSFLHFVDRLLLRHDDSDITGFKVSCDVHVDAVRVQSWISAVINHYVEELDLQFPLTESCILPSCLFSSQSLTKLSINLDGVLGFPSSLSAGCPCLKSLNLSQAEFMSEDSTDELFSDLSSIFPSLQQLSLVRCGWKNINCLEIISSTLESLTMDICCDELLDCEVVVSAPKLDAFSCQTDGSIAIFLACPNSFGRASLDFYLQDVEERDAYESLEILLGDMRNSIHLTVSTEALSASNRFLENLPMFQNLTYIEISGSVWSTTVGELLDFLHLAPNLECLSISLDMGEDRIADWWTADPVPGCLRKKLKKLKILGLDAVESEMYLITFFLKHARNLEEIHVCAHKRNAKKLEKVRKALSPNSGKCVFVFEVSPDDSNEWIYRDPLSSE